jgi:hypothetical protein
MAYNTAELYWLQPSRSNALHTEGLKLSDVLSLLRQLLLKWTNMLFNKQSFTFSIAFRLMPHNNFPFALAMAETTLCVDSYLIENKRQFVTI